MCLPVSSSLFVQPCSIHRLRKVDLCDARAHLRSVQPCSIHRLRKVDLCDARAHLRSVQPCSIHRLRIVDLCDTYAHLRSTVTVRVRAFLVQLCFWLECIHPICFLCFTFVPLCALDLACPSVTGGFELPCQHQDMGSGSAICRLGSGWVALWLCVCALVCVCLSVCLPAS